MTCRHAKLRSFLALVLVTLVLGGCGWLVPKPTELFPDEIAPGWRLAAEGAMPLEDLPAEAAGGWGAT